VKAVIELLKKDRESFVSPEKDWLRSQRGVLICSECELFKADYPDPVDVRLSQIPDGTSYSGVFHVGIGVIHEQLFEELRANLAGVVTGRVHWKDGSLLREYRTIYCGTRVLLRGAADARYYVCGTCGRNLGASSTERPYFIAATLPAMNVHQDAICCMYLHAEVAERLNWAAYPDLEPHPVEVLEEPLPDDPLPGIERAVRQLTAAFEGDRAAAFRAVGEEAASLSVAANAHLIHIEVRGVPLAVRGYVRGGVFRVEQFSTG